MSAPTNIPKPLFEIRQACSPGLSVFTSDLNKTKLRSKRTFTFPRKFSCSAILILAIRNSPEISRSAVSAKDRNFKVKMQKSRNRHHSLKKKTIWSTINTYTVERAYNSSVVYSKKARQEHGIEKHPASVLVLPLQAPENVSPILPHSSSCTYNNANTEKPTRRATRCARVIRGARARRQPRIDGK